MYDHFLGLVICLKAKDTWIRSLQPGTLWCPDPGWWIHDHIAPNFPNVGDKESYSAKYMEGSRLKKDALNLKLHYQHERIRCSSRFTIQYD